MNHWLSLGTPKSRSWNNDLGTDSLFEKDFRGTELMGQGE